MFYNFKVITLSGTARGGKWGHAPWGTSLGVKSTFFIQTFKKQVFRKKFRLKYAYKCIFFEKRL